MNEDLNSITVVEEAVPDDPIGMSITEEQALNEMVAASGTISPQESEYFMDLSEIKCDNLFRCRVENDEDHIEALEEVFSEYKAAMDRGENPDYPVPPIWIYWLDGGAPHHNVMGHVWITGSHRFQAANRAGLDKILVKEFHGTEEEALWFAMRDNRTHGLRLKHGDLKLCIGKALRLFPDKTAGAIAKELGCGRSYAYRVATELSPWGQLNRAEKKRGADGKVRSTKRKPKQSIVRKPKWKPPIIADLEGFYIAPISDQPNENVLETTPEQVDYPAVEYDADGNAPPALSDQEGGEELATMPEQGNEPTVEHEDEASTEQDAHDIGWGSMTVKAKWANYLRCSCMEVCQEKEFVQCLLRNVF